MLPQSKLTFSYLAGGILGGVFYILANLAFGASFQGSYLCGSSAAVLSVMACVAALYPNLSLNLFLFGKIKLKWIVVVCAVLTFLGVGGDSMAISAHIGGLIAGIVMAMSIKGEIKTKARNIFHQFKKKEIQRPLTTTSVSAIKVDNITRAMQNRLSDSERLDQLLDKIRESGYASLTDIERKELNAISANLDKKRQNNIP